MADSAVRGKLLGLKLGNNRFLMLLLGLIFVVLAGTLHHWYPKPEFWLEMVIEVLKGLGHITVSVGLLGLFLEYSLREEHDDLLVDKLRGVMEDNTSKVAVAAVQAIQEPASLARLVPRERVNSYITALLGSQYRGAPLEMMVSGLEGFGEYTEVRRSYRCSGVLSDILDETVDPNIRKYFYDFSCDIEYQGLSRDQLIFCCVSNPERRAHWIQEPNLEYCWFFSTEDPHSDSRDINDSGFGVTHLRVDGHSQSVPKSQLEDSGDLVTKVVLNRPDPGMPEGKIKYTISGRIPKRGHLCYMSCQRPTMDLEMSLRCEAKEVEWLSVVNMIPSSPSIPANVYRTSNKEVRVETSGWVTAASGVTFVWRNLKSQIDD